MDPIIPAGLVLFGTIRERVKLSGDPRAVKISDDDIRLVAWATMAVLAETMKGHEARLKGAPA